jgi:hypothetical protein
MLLKKTVYQVFGSTVYQIIKKTVYHVFDRVELKKRQFPVTTEGPRQQFPFVELAFLLKKNS